ncbi:MAG: hypothetical protein QOJ99_476 [Bryobacterales bacterium]|nr:hypothetical protein [Bryobacterales bacterium]
MPGELESVGSWHLTVRHDKVEGWPISAAQAIYGKASSALATEAGSMFHSPIISVRMCRLEALSSTISARFPAKEGSSPA